MKKTKENAITLVALVITIIVLLILAGVSIQAITNTGLFANAKKAKEKSIEAQLKEEISLAIQDIQIEETSNAKLFDMKSLIEKIPEKLNDITIESDGEESKGEYKGYNYRITRDYEVIIEGKTNIRIKTEITPKECTKENVVMNVEITSNESPIKRIVEPENLSKNSEGKYIVSKNGQYKFIVETENGDITEKTVTVSNIDKLPPKDFKPEIEKSGTTIKIKENAEDQEETEENACSGIEKYEYYVDGKKYDSNEITNLTIGNTYLVHVIAFDKAGNSTKSSEESVKITVQYKKISANRSSNTVLAIDFDGNIWQWGYGNNYKERGKPKRLTQDAKFVDVIIEDGNYENLLAIDEERNLWQWERSSNPTLRKVMEGVKVKKVSATVSMRTVHIIDEEGNLWAWGQNNYGQLGDGNKNDIYLSAENAKKIAEGIKFKEVCDGRYNALAIDIDGNLWSWGYNSSCMLGNGSDSDTYFPVKISQDVQFEKIFADSENFKAIDKDGNLYNWGYAAYGLGDGTTEVKKQPIQIINGTKFTKAIASIYTQYALDINGNLWGWGRNEYDQLGIGNTQNQYLPIKVMEGTKFKEIYGYYNRGILVDENNNVYFYGRNDLLKYNTGIKKIGQIPNLKQIVFPSSDTILAIDENGDRWGWGDNDYGELGNGTAYKVVNQLTKID